MDRHELFLKKMSDYLEEYEQMIEQDKTEYEAQIVTGKLVEPVVFNESIGEMDENKQWAVVYTYHDHNEDFYVGVIPVNAPEMGEALRKANDPLQKSMWENRWSDYIVIGVIMMKEVH